MSEGESDEDDKLATTREWIKAPHVVSEINTFLVTSTDLCPLVKSTNRIAKLSFSQPCTTQPNQNVDKVKHEADAQPELQYDKDGDPILTSIRAQAKGTRMKDENLFIEFENSTTLDLVGLQIWRGALLLADFIMHNQSLFKDKIVLELGSGTGLSSVVASFYASKVIATDLNEPDILNLIRANKDHNQRFVNAQFLVIPLDFMDLNWSEELEKCAMEADIILAADVVYHNKITEALVRTLQKCLATGKPKNVYIALEKRYVFTIADLDTVAPMYDNFMDLLQSIVPLSLSPTTIAPTMSTHETNEKEDMPPSTVVPCNSMDADAAASQYNLVPVSTDFPQYFNYEKTKELMLWNIRRRNVVS